MEEQNVLKVRDDLEPIMFTKSDSTYTLKNKIDTSWITNGNFTKKDLRYHIEPWLTALFQSEHLSLLLGSGLTHAVHYLATGTQATGMEPIDFGKFQSNIDDTAKKISKAAGREQGNLEDQLRVAIELLNGLKILQKNSDVETLKEQLKNGMKNFAESVLSSESNIVTSVQNKREKAFTTLIAFLMSFASRTGTRDRLNIFTTNYDRLIEFGAELAGLHLLDRFVGNLLPIFRSSRLDLDMHYNPPGIRGEPRYLEGVVRFTKLHGSLDWVQADDDIRRMGLPFGAKNISPYLQLPGFLELSPYSLMIYPNSAKDRETADYPYVELFRDFASAICRPNSTLVTYGYSFGDEHINRVIRDMLTIPSTHLVIISYNDPLGCIKSTYKKVGRHSQISLLIGPELADLITLTEEFLPKPAIDKTTFRMSELLKHRLGEQQREKTSVSSEGSGIILNEEDS